MSNFILNLVRRGAGLAPTTALQPSYTPSFMPDTGTSRQTEPEPEVPSSQQEAPPISFSSPQVLTSVMPTQEQLSPHAEAMPLQPEQSVMRDPFLASPAPEDQQRPTSQHIRYMMKQVLPRVSPARTAPEVEVPDDVPEPTPPADTHPRPLIQPAYAEPAPQPQTVYASVVRSDLGLEVSAQVQPVLPDTMAKTPLLIKPAPIQSPAFPVLERPAARPSEPPPIHVRIGTIEVRATTPPAPSPPPAPKPRGFDAYAHIRNYVNWGQY